MACTNTSCHPSHAFREYCREHRIHLVKAWLGGDEFGAIIPIVNEAKLKTICGKLLSALDTPFVVDRVPVDLSASVGIAHSPVESRPNVNFRRLASINRYTDLQVQAKSAISNRSR